MGLGHFKDNLGLMMSAVRYIAQSRYYEVEESLQTLELVYTI